MTGNVQLDQPPADLLAASRRTVPGWLRRVTLAAVSRTAIPTADQVAAIDGMVEVTSKRVLARLHDLLTTDVDEQTTNPLSLFRDAVEPPTSLLRSFGVPPPLADPFGRERFPDDVYLLGPATWADIDQSLHDVGLTWGAWKAMTILRRRRDEGLR